MCAHARVVCFASFVVDACACVFVFVSKITMFVLLDFVYGLWCLYGLLAEVVLLAIWWAGVGCDENRAMDVCLYVPNSTTIILSVIFS